MQARTRFYVVAKRMQTGMQTGELAIWIQKSELTEASAPGCEVMGPYDTVTEAIGVAKRYKQAKA